MIGRGDPDFNTGPEDPGNIRIVDIRENLSPRLWRASLHCMPYSILPVRAALAALGVTTFKTEKEAIDISRQARIEEINRLQREVDTLDLRYDAIEDAEIARES